MTTNDIIHLLPDSVANQIAAGEVVQRPSSVVKELMENAIDAGAAKIEVNIKDAGRTLILVIDDGKGMSPTDARLSFERHATSKIRQADDLFSLRTMGFRGEALASIAAVAQVELKTKREEDELGTCIEIDGSQVVAQEPVSCANGSVFAIKNLFYNIPARRKFLKSNTTEFGHIIECFHRIAIIYPEIEFILRHNDDLVIQLPQSNLCQRIVNIFGNSIKPQLLSVNAETAIVKVKGYIGRPESARKQSKNQYFFANGRYMRHPYFHRAVMQAYGRMLPPDTVPSYFICLDVEPSQIDVNIHPTKTEIKFENEQVIWSILLASVKEALGKFNVTASIDFDQQDSVDIPVLSARTPIVMPQTGASASYNPFKQDNASGFPSSSFRRQASTDWEQLYQSFEKDGLEAQVRQSSLDLEDAASSVSLSKETKLSVSESSESKDFLQYKGKYILTSVKSGLMMIDQHLASIRVLYEQYRASQENKKSACQQLLFPELINLSPKDSLTMERIKDDVNAIGFDIEFFGQGTYKINGAPSALDGKSCVKVVEDMIAANSDNQGETQDDIREKIALSLARNSAVDYNVKLSEDDMLRLTSQLFLCANCNYTPDGKPIISVWSDSELDGKMK